jgi:hypothetical protein
VALGLATNEGTSERTGAPTTLEVSEVSLAIRNGIGCDSYRGSERPLETWDQANAGPCLVDSVIHEPSTSEDNFKPSHTW